MPNITTNHAITYINIKGNYFIKASFKYNNNNDNNN